jgi:hypothetical protein
MKGEIMPETICTCDCHDADGGGLVCSACWRAHERQVAEDIKTILRGYATDDYEDDEE